MTSEAAGSRRNFLKFAGAGTAATGILIAHFAGETNGADAGKPGCVFDVRRFGAKGDGGHARYCRHQQCYSCRRRCWRRPVFFPAGTYASYSIHLKSFVCLYLEPGATILAASTPLEGTTSGGYDAAEPQGAWEPYQDYGHNHWHNSLIWGEDIRDVAILGPGLIWGKG